MKKTWKFKIEYWQAPSKQWYFHMRGRNGKILAQSEGYSRWAKCESTINIFREFAHNVVFITDDVSHCEAQYKRPVLKLPVQVVFKQ